MSFSLEQVVGFKIKVTNVLDNVTHGKIYAYDSVNNTLTLVSNKRNQNPTFDIIKTSFIKQIEVCGDRPASLGFKRDAIKPTHVNIKRVTDTLKDKIAEARKKEELIGKGTTPEGQLVFDSVHKTVSDTRWQGKSIIVLDELEITPPYTLADIKSINNKEAHSKGLVSMIVDNTWKKIEAQKKGG
ncbi:HCL424Wp [Eremothecium sinecaudum]|uniref:HCL424Wp n=1 Tax=Eremothecium sinecaudum TaxID=45286 RepID=A0A120K1U1_9SACH|nr:HCL424Wp [Eremothecium sinecaudum]AMD19727.1 HCL424Wp [Eremothecium sinecaudum]